MLDRILALVFYSPYSFMIPQGQFAIALPLSIQLIVVSVLVQSFFSIPKFVFQNTHI